MRLEDVLADPVPTLGKVCEAVGLESAKSLRQPTWNGEALDQVFPWGTIVQATPAANRRTAEELTDTERDEIRAYTWQYLDVFDYAGFLD